MEKKRYSKLESGKPPTISNLGKKLQIQNKEASLGRAGLILEENHRLSNHMNLIFFFF